MSTIPSPSDGGLDALIAQYGAHAITMVSAICMESARVFGTTPPEILRLLSKATPEELRVADDVAKGLHLIGVLYLREVDRGLADAASRSDGGEPTSINLTLAPQYYRVMQQRWAEAETAAVIASARRRPDGSHTIH